MEYAELVEAMLFDEYDTDSWPGEMREAYIHISPAGDVMDVARRHFLGGIVYERRRAQAERAQQVETAQAALREAHPVIGA